MRCFVNFDLNNLRAECFRKMRQENPESGTQLNWQWRFHQSELWASDAKPNVANIKGTGRRSSSNPSRISGTRQYSRGVRGNTVPTTRTRSVLCLSFRLPLLMGTNVWLCVLTHNDALVVDAKWRIGRAKENRAPAVYTLHLRQLCAAFAPRARGKTTVTQSKV